MLFVASEIWVVLRLCCAHLFKIHSLHYSKFWSMRKAHLDLLTRCSGKEFSVLMVWNRVSKLSGGNNSGMCSLSISQEASSITMLRRCCYAHEIKYRSIHFRSRPASSRKPQCVADISSLDSWLCLVNCIPSDLFLRLLRYIHCEASLSSTQDSPFHV